MMTKHVSILAASYLAVAFSLESSVAAFAQQNHSIVLIGDTDLHQMPALRFERPQWIPLRGDQIKELIADRSLIIDENFEVAPGIKVSVRFMGGCPPVKTFDANGRWRMSECQRSLRKYNGRWSVETFRGGERLCVEAKDFAKSCRFVWQGMKSDRLILPPASSAPVEGFADWYDPYRLVKR